MEENLAYKAVKWYEKYVDQSILESGIHVTLRKRIPVGAGLGGGSADAGAILRILQRKSGIDMGGGDIVRRMAQIGMDVPACFEMKSRWVSGIGEKLGEEITVPWRKVLLATYPVHVSTKKIYDIHRNTMLTKKAKLDRRVARVGANPMTFDLLHNDLEDVALQHVSGLTRLKKALQKAGADGIVMSGSGPTLVTMWNSTDMLYHAHAEIAAQFPTVVLKVAEIIER